MQVEEEEGIGEIVNGLHGVSRRMKYVMAQEKTNTKHISEGNFFRMGFRSKEPTEKDNSLKCVPSLGTIEHRRMAGRHLEMI